MPHEGSLVVEHERREEPEPEREPEPDVEPIATWKIVAGAFAFPIVWWGIWLMASVLWGRNPAQFALVGDSFAPVAGALSAGALFLLLRSNKMQDDALRLQRNELRLQRKEFELTRHELAGQAQALREQLQRMDDQRRTLEMANAINRSQLQATGLTLGKMDEQRRVMDEANRINRAQVELDAFALLRNARSASDKAKGAAEREVQKCASPIPGKSHQTFHVEFLEMLQEGDYAKMDTWFTETYGNLKASDLKAAALEAIDAIRAMRYAESLVREAAPRGQSAAEQADEKSLEPT